MNSVVWGFQCLCFCRWKTQRWSVVERSLTVKQWQLSEELCGCRQKSWCRKVPGAPETCLPWSRLDLFPPRGFLEPQLGTPELGAWDSLSCHSGQHGAECWVCLPCWLHGLGSWVYTPSGVAVPWSLFLWFMHVVPEFASSDNCLINTLTLSSRISKNWYLL